MILHIEISPRKPWRVTQDGRIVADIDIGEDDVTEDDVYAMVGDTLLSGNWNYEVRDDE